MEHQSLGPPAPRGGRRRGLGTKFYVAGGFNDQGNSTDLHVYDPATNSWRTLAPLPVAGVAAEGAAVQGRLFVVSLILNAGTRTLKAHSYDPATNTWKPRAAPPVFGKLTRVFLEGRAYVLLVASNATYLYTP